MTLARHVAAVALLSIIGTTAWAAPKRPAAPPPPLFTLVNRMAQPIRELFVTPAGNGNWGQNRLDGKNGNPTGIAAGGSYGVRRRADANCQFDIRVVYADGHSEDRRGVNICAMDNVVIGAAASAALDPATGKPGDDPSIRLFNRAAIPITEIYATPSGLTNWGQNRLNAGALKPDDKFLVQLPRDGNCYYDLRVVFADHKAREQKHANLCRFAEMPVP